MYLRCKCTNARSNHGGRGTACDDREKRDSVDLASSRFLPLLQLIIHTKGKPARLVVHFLVLAQLILFICPTLALTMKLQSLYLLVAPVFVSGQVKINNTASLCQAYNLTFDSSPGVSPPESRGLILPEDYYQGMGITSLACVRSNKTPQSSTCRLFDTSTPVGLWNVPPCDCDPNTCSPINMCGDPDLASNIQGNILIVEERSLAQAPFFPPDDGASGGSILIEFQAPTTVLTIGFMDIEQESPVIMEVRSNANIGKVACLCFSYCVRLSPPFSFSPSFLLVSSCERADANRWTHHWR